MASLTSQLGFQDDWLGFNQAQNQDVGAYLFTGLGMVPLVTAIAQAVPKFNGPALDFLLMTPNTIGRELVEAP